MHGHFDLKRDHSLARPTFARSSLLPRVSAPPLVMSQLISLFVKTVHHNQNQNVRSSQPTLSTVELEALFKI